MKNVYRASTYNEFVLAHDANDDEFRQTQLLRWSLLFMECRYSVYVLGYDCFIRILYLSIFGVYNIHLLWNKMKLRRLSRQISPKLSQEFCLFSLCFYLWTTMHHQLCIFAASGFFSYSLHMSMADCKRSQKTFHTHTRACRERKNRSERRKMRETMERKILSGTDKTWNGSEFANLAQLRLCCWFIIIVLVRKLKSYVANNVRVHISIAIFWSYVTVNFVHIYICLFFNIVGVAFSLEGESEIQR